MKYPPSLGVDFLAVIETELAFFSSHHFKCKTTICKMFKVPRRLSTLNWTRVADAAIVL